MEKAVIAYLHEAAGQDMLKESPDKLHDRQRHGSKAPTAGFSVTEEDLWSSTFTILLFDVATLKT